MEYQGNISVQPGTPLSMLHGILPEAENTLLAYEKPEVARGRYCDPEEININFYKCVNC